MSSRYGASGGGGGGRFRSGGAQATSDSSSSSGSDVERTRSSPEASSSPPEVGYSAEIDSPPEDDYRMAQNGAAAQQGPEPTSPADRTRLEDESPLLPFLSSTLTQRPKNSFIQSLR